LFGKPSLIIVRTHIAPGSPNKQDTHDAHGAPLGEEEIRLTKQAYGWPSEEPFFIPDEALENFRQAVDRGAEQAAAWRERFEAYKRDFPELAAEFERITARKLPDGWDSEVPTKRPEDGMIATRKASSDVIQWAAERVPELVGGSADLAPSTLTLINGGGDVKPGDHSGRNLRFGIREHGMGAIVNGLTLHGLRAYGATFLIFSDYMKAALRLAAVMHQPSIFVYTHDSIGLGEDGPTHQPIEQLAALRATPNLNVIRPAGFNETALAWQHALETTDRPTCLALSRQGLPIWDPAEVPADAVRRGAYVLKDSEGEPDVILMATGSEVHIAHDALKLLEADGVAVRLVSMPCVDRFAEQDQEYRDSVLAPACRARVSVEAASPLGWHRWVGDDGDVVAMDGFGASAPAKQLYEHFGFTAEKIAARARTVLEKVSERSTR
jgi:transketolase